MTWHRVAKVTDLAVGEIKKVFVEGEALVLCHTESGFYAAEDRCSHLDLPLSDGMIKGEQILCIHHGAHFCLKTGKACSAPAYEPIQVYATKVEGLDILIEME